MNDKVSTRGNHFTVAGVIGNPPYQKDDGGHASSAMPIYQEFVQLAVNADPRLVTLITPSRWFSGGRGLDSFRETMLNDRRISELYDFYDTNDCFPDIDLSGGVSYFKWDNTNEGECHVVSHVNGKVSESNRYLKGSLGDSFIRFNEAVAILGKILAVDFQPISKILSANDPFGYDMRVEGSYKRIKPKIVTDKFDGCVPIYYYGDGVRKMGYIGRDSVRKNMELIGSPKVFIAAAYGERGKFPYQVLGYPFIGHKDAVCTETYLCFGPLANRKECENLCGYISTRLFRLLVMLKKSTQHAMRPVYDFVPMQDFSEPWTDEKLYAKYGITKSEQKFIESLIKPME